MHKYRFLHLIWEKIAGILLPPSHIKVYIYFINPIFTSMTNNISNFAGGNNFSLAKSVLSNFENLNDLSLY